MPQPPVAPANDGWMLGGRYRVLDRIGSGGMAEVFRARDEVLDRLVAVKVFRAEHVAQDDSDTGAHGIERQQLEVAALARLNHPNLIALYDGSLDAAPHAYIVMELIEGPSLAARIAEGPLPEASVREIGIQLADGLGYVHAQGMVHRDVKPENILLGIDRSDDDHTVRARLSDFGIVRLLGSERLTSANFTLGTASYLAPEQARGSAVDPPADIYSLGLVLLEALSGRRMFDGPPLEAALARLSQRPTVPAELPEPWPRLLHAMTEFDPALRPTASEVARTLRDEGSRAMPLVPLAVPVAAGFADAPTGMVALEAPAAPPYGPAPVEPPRRRRLTPTMIAAVLSVLVILTTLGIFLFSGNDSKSPASPPAPGQSPAAQASTTHRSDTPASSGATSGTGKHGTPSAGAKSSTSSAPKTSSSAPPTTSSAPSTSSAPPKPVTSAPHTSKPAQGSSPATSPSVNPPSTSTSAPPTTATSASNSAATTSAAAG